MKIQKIVLPALVAVVVLLLYFSYFSPKDELGLFSDFDTNSTANRDIIVRVLPEKGFIKDQSGGTIFYVVDRAGKEVKVVGPLTLPPGMDITNRVTLRGHLHTDYFHAAEVRTRN